MPISNEVRRLERKWQTGTGWPKRLEWIEIAGLRGWTRQRFDLNFPLMAVTGENGAGKSTVLQCAASVYRADGPKTDRYASDFFPDTTWDQITRAEIGYAVKEGDARHVSSVRKPGERWAGNPDRRQRQVAFIDLSRILPVSARTGYAKLSKPNFKETDTSPFAPAKLSRLSEIMGRTYDSAKMSRTEADKVRRMPVMSQSGLAWSGMHSGAGETTMTELLDLDFPQYSLVLIDEIETSLHPRAQRRLIRDLAARCRERELQVVLTTHSPYVLGELPLQARAYIMQTPTGSRQIVYGVSPEFAMTKMDDVPQFECDLYVEDERAKIMLVEILAAHNAELVSRCQTIPYGASSVGQALGQMVAGRRFPRPSCVFLDGDEGSALGCINLPGGDAPERVVFEELKAHGWAKIGERTGRNHARVADACGRAMVLADHHAWTEQAASALVLSGDTLWQALCAEWAQKYMTEDEAKTITQTIEDALNGVWSSTVSARHSPQRAIAGQAAALVPRAKGQAKAELPTKAAMKAARPKALRSGPKARATTFFANTSGQHSVDEVREAIGLADSVPGRNQARNILVRLFKEGMIRRVSEGVYEPVPISARAFANVRRQPSAR